MGENEIMKSNLPVVIVDLLKPAVRFFCICAGSEMSFEIFGFLREDFS